MLVAAVGKEADVVGSVEETSIDIVGVGEAKLRFEIGILAELQSRIRLTSVASQ